MAVTLGLSDLRGVLSMADAIHLLEEMLIHEAAGRTLASPKFNADFEGGSMRILFAADYESGYCATKAYHSVKSAGVRYIVTLYRLRDGELLALLDGSHITDLRTGAASGVVARRVSVAGPVTAGVIGSGHQARRQLESVASVYRLASAVADTPHAFSEAGELRAAADSGTLPAEKRATLAQVVSGAVKVPPRGMIAFKSVGCALQDLALAGRYYELLQGRRGAPAAADLASVRLPMQEIVRVASRRSRTDASPRA